MFNLMHLGPEKKSQKSQDLETKPKAKFTKTPVGQSAGSLFFGIDELKYQSWNDMSINQLGQMTDASDIKTARNVRIIATKRYEQNKNGINFVLFI